MTDIRSSIGKMNRRSEGSQMTSYKPYPELAGPLYGKDPWPLRFHTHGFDAACFNTLACSIIYSRRQFGTRKLGYDGTIFDVPSGQPPSEHWRDRWTGHQSVAPAGGRTFSSVVELEWISMDSREHTDVLDFEEIFKDRLVLHRIGRSEVKEAWLDAKSIHPVKPDLLVEVNDHTVNVFMRAIVATEAEQIAGNSRSHFRDDIILAWTHTY